MSPRRHAALLRVVGVLGLLLVTVGGCIGPERGAESLILGTIMGVVGILLAVGMIYALRG
ncbi:MAG TPA: hypothetical protein VK661_03490 [Planctomycetota bacterium]|nr:hypothetical protein [Planctomycetota bacterium]